MTRKSIRSIALGASLGALALAAAGAAQAGPVVSLNFEGVNATYPSGFAAIQNFYNGGTSSDGTTGANFGITFSPNALAICLNSTTVVCSNTSRGGLAPGSDKGALFFLSGSNTFMDDPAGFTNGFSFNYVSASQPGSVSAYSGLDGTGTLLATLNLSPNAGSCPGYSAGFCPFSAAGVAFAGIAKSISFAGVANQIVFDDVTFGSTKPGPGGGVPEPSTWAMMLLGLVGAGAALRNSQRKTGAAATA